jgi:hypothetical protein
MRERPILFSAPMVRAILEGRKTMTRRVAKLKPWHRIEEKEDGSHWPWMEIDGADMGHWLPCPYGAPGDRLWVRETFYDPLDGQSVMYRADGELDANLWDAGVRWQPSIHMPRRASRITLEITAVRVERLQDISEADAIAEGLKRITKDGGATVKHGIPDRDGLPGTDDTGWPWRDWSADPCVAFRRLWESINGPGSWDANPWVWVVGVRRVTP